MKVGVLISRSGPAGLWGPSTEACAIMAASEINAAGGIRGAEMQIVIADPGWNDINAAAVASDLVEVEGVDAIVGMHPSNVRQVIKDHLAGRVPYYYTPNYEGDERDPNTIAIGGTDSGLMSRCLPWFVEERRARRFCLLANDYVWPHRAIETAGRIIAESGGRVVSELTIPFRENYDQSIDTIRRLRPDVVVMFLLGEEMVKFNRAFAEAGLADTIMRFGLGVDENVLMGIGAESTPNLYAATTFTPSFKSFCNEHFMELYHRSFGEFAPSVSVFGQSCYEGIHLAGAVARHVGAYSGRRTAQFVSRLRRDSVRHLLPRSKFAEESRVHFVQADGIGFNLIKTH